jgi:hypothetical protein
MTTLELINAGHASTASIFARASAIIHNFAENVRFGRRMARNLAALRARDPHILADICLSHFGLMPEDAQEALYRRISRDSSQSI